MYLISSDGRAKVVESVLRFLPPESRDNARTAITEIADLFEGQDANALGVLHRAAERGRFHEYVGRLRDFYETKGKAVPVDVRPLPVFADPVILSRLLFVEKTIQLGHKSPDERTLYPRNFQEMMRSPEAIEMELFFLDCYRRLG